MTDAPILEKVSFKSVYVGLQGFALEGSTIFLTRTLLWPQLIIVVPRPGLNPGLIIDSQWLMYFGERKSPSSK